MSKVSDEILDAGREMFRRNPTLDLGTRLDLAYEAVALAERAQEPQRDQVILALSRYLASKAGPPWVDAPMDGLRAEYGELADLVIAAMNRAPQPRLRAIRQALAAIGNIAENGAANECSMRRIVDALADPAILAELSTTPQPSINAEMLAALKMMADRCADLADILECDKGYDAVGFLRASAKRARAIVAKASDTRKESADG